VAFYEGVLGRPPDMSMPEQGFWGWQAGKSYFSILKHSEMSGKTTDAGRILLNFETGDVKTEFQRIKALGATVVREPYQMGTGWLATLADPDGNYFQLVTPM
jgi:predicted enzyme related to lactoylglutathione lyase